MTYDIPVGVLIVFPEFVYDEDNGSNGSEKYEIIDGYVVAQYINDPGEDEEEGGIIIDGKSYAYDNLNETQPTTISGYHKLLYKKWDKIQEEREEIWHHGDRLTTDEGLHTTRQLLNIIDSLEGRIIGLNETIRRFRNLNND